MGENIQIVEGGMDNVLLKRTVETRRYVLLRLMVMKQDILEITQMQMRLKNTRGKLEATLKTLLAHLGSVIVKDKSYGSKRRAHGLI